MRFVIVCLGLGVACARATNGPATVDRAAEEYVRVVLALDRHDADLIDAYTGPPAFRGDAESRYATLDAVVEAAVALGGLLRDATGDPGRRAFLSAQVKAIEHRARWRRGEPVTIRDEAAALGVPIPAWDAARVTEIRSRLDRALPGRGALADRIAQAQRASAVPRSRLDAVMRDAIDACRARTREHLTELTSRPATFSDEGYDVRYVLDMPWFGYTKYLGGGQSVIAVRRDVVASEADLRVLACHETYPGHHVQYVIWDRELRDARGWIEFSVTPLFTPHGVMAERAASAAASLVVPLEARPEISRWLDALAPFALSAAASSVDEPASRDAMIARLRDDLLMPDPEAFVAFVRRYRVQAAAYATPLDGTLDWARYAALLRSPAAIVGAP